MAHKLKWAKSTKKLKKYKVVLIKDYVDLINIALDQKADMHYHLNKKIKNKLGKLVPIDRVVGDFCLMVKDCVNSQYKQQSRVKQ